MKKIFALDVMITPKITVLFYWLALFIFFVSGVNTMFFQEQINILTIGRGVGIMFFGALISRVISEFIIIIFTLSSDLKATNKLLEKK